MVSILKSQVVSTTLGSEVETEQVQLRVENDPLVETSIPVFSLQKPHCGTFYPRIVDTSLTQLFKGCATGWHIIEIFDDAPRRYDLSQRRPVGTVELHVKGLKTQDSALPVPYHLIGGGA
jgi:hypothetical protein